MEAGDGNLILLAYEEFVQDLAQIFRDVCKSNFLQLQLVVTPNLLSENRESNMIEKREGGKKLGKHILKLQNYQKGLQIKISLNHLVVIKTFCKRKLFSNN